MRRYVSSTNTWDQIGLNIELDQKNTDATDCLAISQNGNIVAIGGNNDGTSSQGAVRVYEYNGETDRWIQLGSTIFGENDNDEFGISVDMTDDGSVIIVGAWKNDDTGGNHGNARVFEYSDGSWTQVGSNIIPNPNDNDPVYFGRTVRVSGNGVFFAVNGYQSENPAGDRQSGETRVYIREGNSFTQNLYMAYDGNGGDFFGWQTFLNTDGTILAVGSGGFNGEDLHPMKLYRMTHTYDYAYSQGTDLISTGGGGGFTNGTLKVIPGTNITIIVGQAGKVGRASEAGCNTYVVCERETITCISHEFEREFRVIFLFEMVFFHDISPLVPSQTKIEMCTRIHTLEYIQSNTNARTQVRWRR